MTTVQPIRDNNTGAPVHGIRWVRADDGDLWTGPEVGSDDDGEPCEGCGAETFTWRSRDGGVALLDDEPGDEVDDDDRPIRWDWPEHTPERCREARTS